MLTLASSVNSLIRATSFLRVSVVSGGTSAAHNNNERTLRGSWSPTRRALPIAWPHSAIFKGAALAWTTMTSRSRIDAASRHDPRVIVEAPAPGKEVECSLLGNQDPLASPPGEIVTKVRDWYDYEAKYSEGGMELRVPAEISGPARDRVRELACEVFVLCGCSGLARCDFFVDGGDVLVNELNTIPGFTETSVYGKLLEADGIGYPELCDRLVKLALERYADALAASERWAQDSGAMQVHAYDQEGALLGQGTLAMTIEQGREARRYQGFVPLDRESLQSAAHTYFRQSEQIPTRIRIAVAEMFDRDAVGESRQQWRAGGIIGQFLPESWDRIPRRDLPGGDLPEGAEEPPEVTEDDAWIEAAALVDTVEDHELIDPGIPAERLLIRLFHERGVRVFNPIRLEESCTCSRQRIARVLEQMGPEEIAEAVLDGEIHVRCEFCGAEYRFDPAPFMPREG